MGPIDALKAILSNPSGCVYCDSGALRRPPAYPHATPNSEHEPTCGFFMAQQIIEATDEPAEMVLRKAIEDFLAGNYPHPRTSRPMPCRHGVEYYNECEACNEAHFQNALAATASSSRAEQR